jgi:hypothetical protein
VSARSSGGLSPLNGSDSERATAGTRRVASKKSDHARKEYRLPRTSRPGSRIGGSIDAGLRPTLPQRGNILVRGGRPRGAQFQFGVYLLARATRGHSTPPTKETTRPGRVDASQSKARTTSSTTSSCDKAAPSARRKRKRSGPIFRSRTANRCDHNELGPSDFTPSPS